MDDHRSLADALREREAQYREIFEATGDGLIISDLETGQVLEVNPAMCRMHGYSAEEFTTLERRQFIHPDYHDAVADYLATIAAGGRYRIQAVDIRKDGSLLDVDVHGSPITWRGRRAILGVVRDISAQVRARELLEQRVAERTSELETLLEVARTLSSTLDLNDLLALICEIVGQVVESESASIGLFDEDVLVQVASRRRSELVGTRIAAGDAPLISASLMRGEEVNVGDVRAGDPLAMEYRGLLGNALDTTHREIQSWLIVPLVTRGRTIGTLGVSSVTKHAFSEHHVALVAAFASHAAVAVENARLYERVARHAANEERQRLARELHDSVSQALFGISLGANAALAMLERDPTRLGDSLNYILNLAEIGMAEMRALIFELRPESLEQEGLVRALEKHTAALAGRYRIQIERELSQEPEARIEVKEALYRVAQEALHNTVKHAAARTLRVRLLVASDAVTLEVRDDGRGFDADASFPGHLGLTSMRERMVRVGGTLAVTSTPGAGTTVVAQVPLG